MNFDNVIKALQLVFQVITLEGWSQQMYNYQDTVSYVSSAIFFVCVVILGAFVTVNLVLASIMNQFLLLEKNMPLPGSICLYAMLHKTHQNDIQFSKNSIIESDSNKNGKSQRYVVLHTVQVRGKTKFFQFFVTENIQKVIDSLNRANRRDKARSGVSVGVNRRFSKKKVTLIIQEHEYSHFRHNKRT